MPHLSDVLQCKGQTSFVASLLPLGVLLVLLEVFTSLVNGIVSQMHEQIVYVSLIGTLVLTGRQPAQTFLEKVNSKGVNTTKQHVNSQIKLQLVN